MSHSSPSSSPPPIPPTLLRWLTGAKGRRDREPFHVAATSRTVMVLYVVGRGDIEAREEEGETPLISAAYDGRLCTMTALLSLGAEVNAIDRQASTALIAAVMCTTRNSFSAVGALLEAGADVNYRNYCHDEDMGDEEEYERGGYTALILAAERHDDGELCWDLVRLLLRWGADATCRGPNGQTAEAAVTVPSPWHDDNLSSGRTDAILRLFRCDENSC